MTQAQPEHVPVRVYQSDNRLMIAAPMPGLEPEDISVTVAGNRVTINGQLRGKRQEDMALLVDEWTVGPYYREIVLPQPVDGQLSNASYGNGVLVLMLPKLSSSEQHSPAEYHLEAIGATRGERVGHMGQEILPSSTTEHRQQVHQTVRTGGGQPGGHGADRS